MKIEIDKFISLTGWTPQTGSTISAHALNEHKSLIANNQSCSVVFKIPAGNLNKYIEKTISVDLTGYNEVVFSTWSRNKSRDSYGKAADYYYRINFGGSDSYYFGTSKEDLKSVQIGLTGAPITKIKITALHNDEDYIVMSYMCGVLEEMPYDLYIDTKAALETELYNVYANGFLTGTVTAAVGSSSVSLLTGTANYLERYAVIKIKDGTHEETHQILSTDESTFKFTSMYDGATLLYSYTGANLYLITPVEFNPDSTEAVFPGIKIWNMAPEPEYRGSALENVFDTFKTDTTATVRREGGIQKYTLLVDCEARHDQMLAFLSMIVRKWIAKQTLWCNGMKLGILNEGAPIEPEVTEASMYIPKIQYTFSVEVKEEMYDRVTAYAAITDYLNLYIS
jgi:hypothetical protein